MDVLQLIVDEDKAVSYAKIRDSLGHFDRVTLYRTLHTLVGQGIVHKAVVDQDEVYYALCSDRCDADGHHHRHIHFKCSRCQEVSCVPAAELTGISVPGFMIDELDVTATGLCGRCAKD